MIFVDVSNNPDAILDQQAIDDEFYTAALKEMISLGLDIARIIHQKVVAQSLDSPHTPIDEATSLAFDRISRAVRRTVLLAKNLNNLPPLPLQRERAGVRVHPQAEPLTQSELQTGTITPAKTPESEPREPREPRERLDPPERLETLENRPTLDIINDIRKDLGKPPLLLPLPLGEGRGEGPPASTNDHPPRPVARIAPSRCGNTNETALASHADPHPAPPIAPSRCENPTTNPTPNDPDTPPRRT